MTDFDFENVEVLEVRLEGGDVLAGYRIRRILADEPGVESVYEATAPGETRVAVKVRAQPQSREFRRQFRRLAAVRADLEHPNLLRFYGGGESEYGLYVVSALSQAPTLAELIQSGPPEAHEAVRLLGQVAEALEVAHARGLVHRELTPATVLVEPRDGGRALLSDFGIAKPDPQSGLLEFIESPHYLSPEEIRGEPLGPQSNVYSLACILYECLTGSVPYPHDWQQTVAYAHVADPPPLVSAHRSDLPEAIDDVIATGMAKDTDERYASPRELIRAASAALRAEPGAPRTSYAGRTGAVNGRPAALKRRPRRLAAGLGVAAVLAIGAVGYALGHGGSGSEPRAAPTPARPAQAELDRQAYLRAADTAITRLDARRTARRRRLARARTGHGQAGAAIQLARAYRAARSDLDRVDPQPPGAAHLDASLERTEVAYLRLASAARRGRRAGYRAARRSVLRRERAVRAAIAAVSRP